MLKHLYIVGILILVASHVHGQATDCQQTLLQANDEFNAGRFYGIPNLLSECLDNFSNEQKVQAYHLLVQTYLIIDDPVAAEDSYLKLLQANPEYVATLETDPVDVVYLSSKFTATPVFTPHLRFGGNASIQRLIHPENPFSRDVTINRIPGSGIQVGGGVDWNLNDNISLCIDGLYSYRTVKVNTSGIDLSDDLFTTERQSWVDFPVYVKYKDAIGKIRPYGYAGFGLNLLLRSAVQLTKVNKSPTLSEGQTPTTGPNEIVTYKRNFLNRSLVIGGGIYYKIGKDFLFADVRYSAGFSNIVNEENNLYDEDGETLSGSVPLYGYIGDLHRQDFVAVSIGYVRPIYDPRKLKKARKRKFKGVE